MVNANQTEIANIERREKECVFKPHEIEVGNFTAESLKKVRDGYVSTSILNTNDVEEEIQEPLVELDIEAVRNLTAETEEKQKGREKRILEQLTLDNLNDEENKLLIGTFQDYQLKTYSICRETL
jgi:hypothetical protein